MVNESAPGMFERLPAQAEPALPSAASAEVLVSRPSARNRGKLVWRYSRWHRRAYEPAPDPSLSEEEALTVLYGHRTGTVVASAAEPPLH